MGYEFFSASWVRATERGKEAWSVNRELMIKNRIEGATKQGEWAIDHETLAKTINGLFKAEFIHRRGLLKSRKSVKLDILQWMHWFNNIRFLEPIGYIPPAGAEANYWRQLDEKAEADHLIET